MAPNVVYTDSSKEQELWLDYLICLRLYLRVLGVHFTSTDARIATIKVS